MSNRNKTQHPQSPPRPQEVAQIAQPDRKRAAQAQAVAIDVPPPSRSWGRSSSTHRAVGYGQSNRNSAKEHDRELAKARRRAAKVRRRQVDERVARREIAAAVAI